MPSVDDFAQEANATHTGYEFLNEDHIFDTFNTAGWFFIISSFVLLALVTVVVGLRLYTRIRISRSFGWDDVACICTYLAIIAHSVFCVDMVRRGAGRPASDFIHGNPHLPMYMYHIFQNYAYMLATWFLKLTILGLMLRTLSLNKKIRWTCYGLIAFISAAHLGAFLRQILLCQPVSSLWKETVHKVCPGQDGPDLITMHIVIVITDLIVICLPVKTLWNLCLPRRERIALILIFQAGIIATILSIIRMGLNIHSIYFSNNGGVPVYQLGVSGQFEICVGLILACLPPLKAFASSFFPRLLNSYHSRSASLPLSNVEDAAQFSRADATQKGFRTLDSKEQAGDEPIKSPKLTV